MRILVNATAMNARGAFSVMDSFLSDMNKYYSDFKDMGIKMHFLAANEKLCKHSNDSLVIDLVTYPKQSWLHKWNYENRILPKLFKDNNCDVYLSMQNYVLTGISKPQFVLMHQPIPFSDLTVGDLEFTNWLKYSLIFKYILRRQRRKVTGAIVQTAWMKRALIDKFGYNCPIEIIRPPVTDILNNDQPLPKSIERLFKYDGIKLCYPTNTDKYKNNERLCQAINHYNEKTLKKVTLYLTIDGKSSEYIKFLGKVPYESIYTLYKNIDAVIFPSLTETLGLPLLEAQLNSIPVIASDLPYAREMCGDNCIYFDPRNAKSIAEGIKSYVNRGRTYRFEKIPTKTSYFDYITFIQRTLEI